MPDTGTPPRTKVLFILGSGRNGSTLLANLLGSSSGGVNIGEAQWIWERGVLQNRVCGCGELFDDCPFWSTVLDGTGASETAIAERNERTRLEALNSLGPRAILGRFQRRWETSSQRRFRALTEQLYLSVAATGSTPLVVDSSKRPVYARVLRRTPSLDVYVLHLVRDPRAVSFSWLRKKPNPDFGGLMPIHPSWKSAAGWMVWNLWAEAMRLASPNRYLRLRYEDLINNPAAILDNISKFVAEDLRPDLISHDEVVVQASHSISGNPSRFNTGTVRVREDAEWSRAMKRRDRLIVQAITWPLMVRYGYSTGNARR